MKESTGDRSSVTGLYRYGYQWWSITNFGYYYAYGFVGQIIGVHPDTNITVQMIAWGEVDFLKVMNQYVILAVIEEDGPTPTDLFNTCSPINSPETSSWVNSSHSTNTFASNTVDRWILINHFIRSFISLLITGDSINQPKSIDCKISYVSDI
ncbi:MAG: hypothetical protein IH840_13285 [Candidatus Heimdallarchaeota archaeon]|nr:hypothetical protein [Candidatus Heimdallarchaeota archaeon]